MKNNISQPASKQEPLLWLVAIGFFMQSLDATDFEHGLAQHGGIPGRSPLHMQSVVVAYALTTAMLIPATGWVADRFGTRRIYTAAMALFVLRLGLVCAGPYAAVFGDGAGGAGGGRRHDAARGAAGSAARLSARCLHPRHEFHCHSGAGGALDGAGAGWLAGGVCIVALDFLDQCADWHRGRVGGMALDAAE